MPSVAKTQRFLKDNLSQYSHSSKVQTQVVNTVHGYGDLATKRDFYYHPDGKRSDWLHMVGTIPVIFKGTRYNIPIIIWIPEQYPDKAPICLVQPTPTMVVRPGRHVDANGMVYLPYLNDWKKSKSTLVGLVHVICGVFGEEPPVFSRPANQPFVPPTPGQWPSTVATASVATTGSMTTSTASSSNATQPPYLVQPGPSSVRPAVSNSNATPTIPVAMPTPSGGVRTHGSTTGTSYPPEQHFQPAVAGASAGGVTRHNQPGMYPSTSSASSARRTLSSGPPYPNPHTATHPQLASGSGGVPYPMGPGAGAGMPNHMQQPQAMHHPPQPFAGQSTPYPPGQQQQQPQAQQQPTASPYPSQYPTPYPSSTQAFPGLPGATATTAAPSSAQPAQAGNLSIVATTAAGMLTPSTTTATSSSAHPMFAAQPSLEAATVKASLVSAVEDKLRRRLSESQQLAERDMSQLGCTQSELLDGSQRLQRQIEDMHTKQDEMLAIIVELSSRETEVKTAVAQLQTMGDAVDLDDVVVAELPLHRQMLDLLAEDNAIDDTIYYLGEGLRRNVIPLDAFLKNVRELSRRQFFLRAKTAKAQFLLRS